MNHIITRPVSSRMFLRHRSAYLEWRHSNESSPDFVKDMASHLGLRMPLISRVHIPRCRSTSQQRPSCFHSQLENFGAKASSSCFHKSDSMLSLQAVLQLKYANVHIRSRLLSNDFMAVAIAGQRFMDTMNQYVEDLQHAAVQQMQLRSQLIKIGVDKDTVTAIDAVLKQMDSRIAEIGTEMSVLWQHLSALVNHQENYNSAATLQQTVGMPGITAC